MKVFVLVVICTVAFAEGKRGKRTSEPIGPGIHHYGSYDEPCKSELSVCASIEHSEFDGEGTTLITRKCGCPGDLQCPETIDELDGHTVKKDGFLYKTCAPLVPRDNPQKACRRRERALTLTGLEEVTELNCVCQGSVARVHTTWKPDEWTYSNPFAPFTHYASCGEPKECRTTVNYRTGKSQACSKYYPRIRDNQPVADFKGEVELCKCPGYGVCMGRLETEMTLFTMQRDKHGYYDLRYCNV